MAHFAEVKNTDNKVLRVVVISNDDVNANGGDYSSDAEVFVKVGDNVTTGQTLCIIEAMKIMNEIEAETTGSIKKILVENAQPVEFGQSLFVILPH